MSSEYPTYPRIGVGAIVVRDGQVLLIRRGSEPGRGLWSIPGGRLELGETITDAARREVKEECSIEIIPNKILHVDDLIIPDDAGRVRFHYVLIDVLANYERGEVMPGSDALDARWVDLEVALTMNLTSDKLRNILGEIRDAKN